MNRLKSIVLASCAAVVALTIATVPAQSVQAQESASLSIAPKKSYLIEPGKSVKDKLTIRNLDQQSSLQLNLRVVDFTFTGDGGTPKLFLDPKAPQTTWSLKPYLTIPKTVTIPKGSSKTIDMNVAMPAGHGAGSFYSAIIYSTGAPDGGNVGLSASGVTLVFAQVPGKVNEDLKLDKFGAYTEDKAGKKADYVWLATEEPQRIAYTLKNSGNVTEAPAGSITLRSMWGKEYEITNVNPNGSLALIGQTRTYTACIKLKQSQVELEGSQTPANICEPAGLWPGYYSASLDLFYGQNGNLTQEITSKGSFLYLPVWFIILVLVLLAILGYFIWRAVNFVRGKSQSRARIKKPGRK